MQQVSPMNSISILNNTSTNTISINIKSYEQKDNRYEKLDSILSRNESKLFPQRFSIISGYSHEVNNFLPSIKQTFDLNVSKINPTSRSILSRGSNIYERNIATPSKYSFEINDNQRTKPEFYHATSFTPRPEIVTNQSKSVTPFKLNRKSVTPTSEIVNVDSINSSNLKDSTISSNKKHPIVYKRISQYFRNTDESKLKLKGDLIIAAKQKKLKRNIIEFWKIYSLASPLDYKIADIFKNTAQNKLKRKVFHAIVCYCIKSRDKKLNKQLNKAKDEILELKTKISKFDNEKLEALLQKI